MSKAHFMLQVSRRSMSMSMSMSCAAVSAFRPEKLLCFVRHSTSAARGTEGPTKSMDSFLHAANIRAIDAAANHGAAIPVIDFSLQEAAASKVSGELAHALENVGFFFLDNHGIDQKLIAAVFEYTARFHALSIEEKGMVSLNEKKVGYAPFGASLRKGYSKPSGNSSFFMRFNTPPVQNQWPALEGFEDTMAEYAKEIDALAHRLLPLLAQALDLPATDTTFVDGFSGSNSTLRLVHYPDPAKRGVPNGDVGIAAHTDNSIFTFIAQQDKPGLEICMPDGRWLRPQTMPGTILVNAGDMLRRWTNHRWMSALHRVVNLPGQERFSVPLFWTPRADYVMEPLDSCSSGDNPPRYGPLTPAAFMIGWYAGEYTTMRTLTPAQVKAAEIDAASGGFVGVKPAETSLDDK